MHIAWNDVEEVPSCFWKPLNFKVTLAEQLVILTQKTIWIWFEQDYKACRSYKIP